MTFLTQRLTQSWVKTTSSFRVQSIIKQAKKFSNYDIILFFRIIIIKNKKTIEVYSMT